MPVASDSLDCPWALIHSLDRWSGGTGNRLIHPDYEAVAANQKDCQHGKQHKGHEKKQQQFLSLSRFSRSCFIHEMSSSQSGACSFIVRVKNYTICKDRNGIGKGEDDSSMDCLTGFHFTFFISIADIGKRYLDPDQVSLNTGGKTIT